MSKFLAQTKNWRNGLMSEIQFWRSWVNERGLGWEREYNDRISGGANVREYLEIFCGKSISFIDQVSILDVGAGPITQLSTSDERYLVRACDPLAETYNELLAEAGVYPPIQTTFATAEDLSCFFDENSFDVVHCGNALDHSFDPVRGIEEMLFVCQMNGVVVLRHHPNEAAAGGYDGLHQWNFDCRNDRFVIWNREGECDAANRFAGIAECECRMINGNVVAIFTKLATGAIPLEREIWRRKNARIAEISSAVITMVAQRENPEQELR